MRFSAWRVRSVVVDYGTFFCPIEGADRPYVRTEVRRWLAPLGLPLVARARLGEYVQCSECGQSFTEEVLAIVTTEALGSRLETAALALVSAVVERSGGGRDVRSTASSELVRFVGDPRRSVLETPAPALAVVVERLSAAAVHMEELGRRDLFAAAVRVAFAGGDLNAPNFAALHAAGGALRLPVRTIRTLIVSAGARAE